MKPPTKSLIESANHFLLESVKNDYSYNFEWMSRPIIQYPQDMVAIQEIIWKVKPDLVIETGIAHGGSLIFSASLLALLDYCEAQQSGEMIDPAKPKRKVIGVDIEIREHNLQALDNHPLRNRIEIFLGSSIDSEIINKIKHRVKKEKSVLVYLDSNHTHDHVLSELSAYADLVTIGSYCVVFDTVIEDLPSDILDGLSWGRGNNPKTAVHEFLSTHPEFEIDKSIQDKIQVTVAPDGYLKKVR
jgi:cephalosporin hydroxylase